MVERFNITCLALCLWLGQRVKPASAHEGHAHEDIATGACPPGEVCDQAATLGAWGMIGLGVLFWLIALIPNQGPDEAEQARGPTLLSGLQARIDKESTGWRRLQWPILGFGMIALGVATLIGGG